jgi:hypothetical protein
VESVTAAARAYDDGADSTLDDVCEHRDVGAYVGGTR